MKMAEQNLKQKKPMLQKKRTELARTTRPTDEDARKAQKLEEEIAQVQSELSSVNYNEEEESRLGNERQDLLRERQNVDHVVDTFEARWVQLQRSS